MRMWNIDPKLLCRQHLLGEHKELHMFVGSILKGTSIAGYIEKGQVEVHNIRKRHEELVGELERRGYTHSSPLREFQDWVAGEVDPAANLMDLRNRCAECRSRILVEGGV